MKKNFTDEELVEHFVRSREAAYFAELYGRYSHKVYQSCLKMLADDAEAQDQTQEVFYKVFTRISGFRHRASFSTWLYTLTRNHCFSVRQQRVSRRHQSLDDINEALIESYISYDDMTLDERWRIAEKTLSRLSEQHLQILQNRYLLGKEIADMAEE